MNTKSWAKFSMLAALVVCSVASAQVYVFDAQPGNYLAQVHVASSGSVNAYTGYASNYAVAGASGVNLGPALPGGFPVNASAYFDLSTGDLGVGGSGPTPTGDLSVQVRYSEAFQFASSGTFTVSGHFQGDVGTGGATSGFLYEYSHLSESIGIGDYTVYLGSFDQGSAAQICGTTFEAATNCATPFLANSSAPTATVDTELVTTEQVQPGHTYLLEIDMAGTEVGGLTYFSGSDPISIQLSPGLTFAPTPGLTLPEFITASSPSPVPLPATVWLMLSGLGGLGVLARRRTS